MHVFMVVIREIQIEIPGKLTVYEGIGMTLRSSFRNLRVVRTRQYSISQRITGVKTG